MGKKGNAMKIFNRKKNNSIMIDSPNASQENKENEIEDWRDLEALPEEVVSKKELDLLQKEVIIELEHVQASAKKSGDGELTAEPQALFYYHKYIDAKFNKNDFDVETYFARKQNIIDRKYAEGLGELNQEFTGYKELLEEISEYEQRFRRKTNELDPESKMDLEAPGTYDDSAKLLEQIKLLPNEINWEKQKEN